jgi:acyl-CoA thioesterase-1
MAATSGRRGEGIPAPGTICHVPAHRIQLSRPSTEPVTTILCLGDSLTEGYGLAPEHAYPSVLERRLHAAGQRGTRVLNGGISGSTSASAVSRLEWQLRAAPDILILALGGNDGLRGLDLAATRRNLSAAIELAKGRGVRVVLAGMKLPPNYGPAYTGDFERLFPELAAEHDVALIPFLLEGVAARPGLNLPDGIHPNAEGYLRVAENVLEVLLPMLEKDAGSGGS